MGVGVGVGVYDIMSVLTNQAPCRESEVSPFQGLGNNYVYT